MSSSIPPAVTLDSSVHSGLMLSMIDMLVFLSIHDTLSTLLQHHNSKASIFLLSCFLIVQVSAPYSTIGNTNTFTSFTFVSSVTPLSFHIDVSPPIAAFPIAILLRTSFSHSPSSVISAHKKTNCVTTCTSISFRSTVTAPMSPVVITFVFPTFRYSPAFSLARLTLPTSSIKSSLVPASSVVSSAYLRFVTILPPMLIPLSHSSKASLITFSAYILKSSGERIHPCRTPFPMSMLSVSPNSILTVASWLVYSLLSNTIRCTGTPISLSIIHSLSWSTQSKAFL